MTSSTTTTTLSEIDDDEDTTLQATITEPTSKQTINTDESIIFVGKAEGGEPYSDDDPYYYFWYKDDERVNPSDSESTTIDFGGDPEGDYTITFKVRDSRSVTAKDSIEVTVKAVNTNGNCEGCCRSNGGVDCDGGDIQCADGTDLSETCVDNGCACP